MRKRIVADEAPARAAGEDEWLDLDAIASVEVTSEDPAHPIEAALVLPDGGGWRAAAGGEQTLRIAFDAPQRLRRIALEIVETARARTQELAIAWSKDGSDYREIVRQQWNFSPGGSTREVEEYKVDLDDVRALQVTIRPDVGDAAAIASIARLRLA
jgi:hypothetical protein